MMGVTHALIGLLIGSSAGILLSSYTFQVAVISMIGGLFPDLDLLFNHRKTLHFPIGYSLLALITGILFYFVPLTWVLLSFYFFISAAVHSWMDIFGGGLEEKPWIPSSEMAIYSHSMERWFRPRRWIRYDGAPEDLLLSLLVGLPLYLYYDNQLLQGLILLLLVIGVLYVAVRKKLVDWAPEWIKEIL